MRLIDGSAPASPTFWGIEISQTREKTGQLSPSRYLPRSLPLMAAALTFLMLRIVADENFSRAAFSTHRLMHTVDLDEVHVTKTPVPPFMASPS